MPKPAIATSMPKPGSASSHKRDISVSNNTHGATAVIRVDESWILTLREMTLITSAEVAVKRSLSKLL